MKGAPLRAMASPSPPWIVPQPSRTSNAIGRRAGSAWLTRSGPPSRFGALLPVHGVDRRARQAQLLDAALLAEVDADAVPFAAALAALAPRGVALRADGAGVF